MKNIEYQVIGVDECALGYQPQVQQLANIAKNNGAMPYLHEPDEAFFALSLSHQHVKFFAYHEGKMVGFAVLRVLHQWPVYFDFLAQPCQLSALVLIALVDPQYRGLGIGREFLVRRIDAARQIGVKHLYVTVHPQNSVNIKLLRSNGFETIATREIFSTQSLRQIMYRAL